MIGTRCGILQPINKLFVASPGLQLRISSHVDYRNYFERITIELFYTAILIMAPNATTLPLPFHPYYPLDLEIPHYLANQWDTLTLVSIFAAGCAAIFSSTYLLVMRVRPRISTADLVTVLWFVLCTSPFENFLCHKQKANSNSQVVAFTSFSKVIMPTIFDACHSCKTSSANSGKNIRCLIRDIKHKMRSFSAWKPLLQCVGGLRHLSSRP